MSQPPKKKVRRKGIVERKPGRSKALAADRDFTRKRPVARRAARTRRGNGRNEKTFASYNPAQSGHPFLEMLDLSGRCTVAYMQLAMRLTRCKSPMELVAEQVNFAQRIVNDCRWVAQRAVSAWINVTRATRCLTTCGSSRSCCHARGHWGVANEERRSREVLAQIVGGTHKSLDVGREVGVLKLSR